MSVGILDIKVWDQLHTQLIFSIAQDRRGNGSDFLEDVCPLQAMEMWFIHAPSRTSDRTTHNKEPGAYDRKWVPPESEENPLRGGGQEGWLLCLRRNIRNATSSFISDPSSLAFWNSWGAKIHTRKQTWFGGIFFDDLNDRDPEKIFAFAEECLNNVVAAYVPIIEKHKNDSFTEEQPIEWFNLAFFLFFLDAITTA